MKHAPQGLSGCFTHLLTAVIVTPRNIGALTGKKKKKKKQAQLFKLSSQIRVR